MIRSGLNLNLSLSKERKRKKEKHCGLFVESLFRGNGFVAVFVWILKV